MTEETTPGVDVGRLATGVHGLDVVLHGGLLRGGIYVIMGRPGTGKTTLGNQLCFTHVARGGRAAYVTLLAESHARMLANLQSMRFFVTEPVGDSLVYLGAYRVLRDRKLPGLLELLRKVIRDEKATLLLIDGLASAHALGESDVALKEFLVELQMLSAMTDCTTVLLTNMTAEQANSPEHSMVDGLIELTLQRNLQRPVRELEVIKFRGSDHLMGRHDLVITDAGVVVHPRTEELMGRYVAPASESRGRLPTGIPALDKMLHGGILSGSTTMLLGFSGSGKTMLASHFLASGAAKGEAGLYFGFYESPDRLLEATDRVGMGLRAQVDAGRVALMWQPPLRYGLDALGERLLADVQARKVKRLVIDGIDGLRQTAAYPERTIRFLTALVNMLRSLDVTTLVTEETMKLFGPEVEVRVSGISALVENIILLEYLDVGSQLRRLLSVVKQRASGFESSVRELRITDHGIELADDHRSAESILGGGADALRSRARRPNLRPTLLPVPPGGKSGGRTRKR